MHYKRRCYTAQHGAVHCRMACRQHIQRCTCWCTSSGLMTSDFLHAVLRMQCPLPDTSANCRYDWMREALAAWVQRKGWVHLLRHRELSAPVLTQQPWEQPALQPPPQTEQAQPSGTPTVPPAVNRAGWSDGSDLGSESVDSSSRPACPSTQSIESTRGTPPPEPTT